MRVLVTDAIKYHAGDTVTATLDMERGRVGFSLNGIYSESLLSQINTQQLYPNIALKITLKHYTKHNISIVLKHKEGSLRFPLLSLLTFWMCVDHPPSPKRSFGGK